MVKKVIQVPVDQDLLNKLDSLSKKQRKARAELIREACLSYLERIREEEMDSIYRHGYMKIPEEQEAGKAQLIVSGEILSGEPW